MHKTFLLISVIFLAGCGQDSRHASQVERAVAMGLAEVDYVETDALELNMSLLMTSCLPHVRNHLEHAVALLQQTGTGDDKDAKLRAQLSEAIAECRKLEIKYEHSQFVGLADDGDFLSAIFPIEKSLGLKIKLSRQAGDKEREANPILWPTQRKN